MRGGPDQIDREPALGSKLNNDRSRHGVRKADGAPLGDVIVVQANQDHGVIGLRPGASGALPEFRVGDRLRILPNHVCATAAQHGHYWVVDGTDSVLARWERFNGW